MNPIQLKVFVLNADHRLQQMLQAWDEIMQSPTFKQLGMEVQIEVINVAESLQLAREYAILTSPTTIVIMPDGRRYRFIGYTSQTPELLSLLDTPTN